MTDNTIIPNLKIIAEQQVGHMEVYHLLADYTNPTPKKLLEHAICANYESVKVQLTNSFAEINVYNLLALGKFAHVKDFKKINDTPDETLAKLLEKA